MFDFVREQLRRHVEGLGHDHNSPRPKELIEELFDFLQPFLRPADAP